VRSTEKSYFGTARKRIVHTGKRKPVSRKIFTSTYWFLCFSGDFPVLHEINALCLTYCGTFIVVSGTKRIWKPDVAKYP